MEQESGIVVSPRSSHWTANVPAIPTSQSDVVVVGEIVKAEAYLSDDKTGVYSEFTIKISEVLKIDGQAGINSNTIVAERAGGNVRFPSGQVQRIHVLYGQRMPEAGQRYLLFLKFTEGKQDLTILTGYKLQDSHVSALDSTTPYTGYDGAGESISVACQRKNQCADRRTGYQGEARPMKLRHLAMIALFVLANNLFIMPSSKVEAQSVQCKVPALLPKEFVWKEGVTVQVNIDPAWTTTQERTALSNAFINWNNAKTGYCPNITFATPTFNSTPIAGPTINPDPNVPKLQVYKLDPPAHPGDRGGALGQDNGTYTLAARVYINPAVTVPDALTQVLAHEIGHTMGLGECNATAAAKLL